MEIEMMREMMEAGPARAGLAIGAALAAGPLAWSFAEYALHNWLGHLGAGRNHFSRQHLAHHKTPSWFAPTSEKLLAAAVTAAVLAGIAIPLVGPAAGLAFTLSFVLSYGGYELMHRRIHTHAPRHRHGAKMRKLHLAHHFACTAMNHGVTSAIWDRVFRTYRPMHGEKVRIPARHALVWMVDAEGALLERWQDDYELIPDRRAARSTAVAA